MKSYYITKPFIREMLFLTKNGPNLYSVLLQQMYNWEIDWEFMEKFLPWTNIRVIYIDHALWYVRTYKLVPHHFTVFSNTLDGFFEHLPVPDGIWVQPKDPPVGACRGRRYCAVRHMMLLHHGRVPGFDDTMLRSYCTEWLLRLRFEAACRLVKPARTTLELCLADNEDLVEHTLLMVKKDLLDDVFSSTYGE